MSTEVTFVLVFAFLFIGMPIVYYILWRKKKKEGRDIAKHFREFNQAAQRNDVQEVLRIGLMLVWNTPALRLWTVLTKWWKQVL